MWCEGVVCSRKYSVQRLLCRWSVVLRESVKCLREWCARECVMFDRVWCGRESVETVVCKRASGVLDRVWCASYRWCVRERESVCVVW